MKESLLRLICTKFNHESDLIESFLQLPFQYDPNEMPELTQEEQNELDEQYSAFHSNYENGQENDNNKKWQPMPMIVGLLSNYKVDEKQDFSCSNYLHNSRINEGQIVDPPREYNQSGYQLVKLLIGKGANIWAEGNDGITVFQAAIANNHVDIVDYLLQKFPEQKEKFFNLTLSAHEDGLFHKNQTGLLHYSLSYNFKKMAEVLIKHGYPIEQKDMEGKTPSFYIKHKETLFLMLENKASFQEIDNNGVSVSENITKNIYKPHLTIFMNNVFKDIQGENQNHQKEKLIEKVHLNNLKHFAEEGRKKEFVTYYKNINATPNLYIDGEPLFYYALQKDLQQCKLKNTLFLLEEGVDLTQKMSNGCSLYEMILITLLNDINKIHIPSFKNDFKILETKLDQYAPNNPIDLIKVLNVDINIKHLKSHEDLYYNLYNNINQYNLKKYFKNSPEEIEQFCLKKLLRNVQNEIHPGYLNLFKSLSFLKAEEKEEDHFKNLLPTFTKKGLLVATILQYLNREELSDYNIRNLMYTINNLIKIRDKAFVEAVKDLEPYIKSFQNDNLREVLGNYFILNFKGKTTKSKIKML